MITHQTKDTQTRTLPITYETISTYPGTLPSATIYMKGLLCLCFDHAKKCTVAVNNMAGNEHEWKFTVVDLDSHNHERIVDLKGDLYRLREVNIDVQGGAARGTHVYNGSTVSIPINERRYNLEGYWVDLEGPRGHDRKVENDAKTLWPRFYINQGLFCASSLSTRSYDLRNTNSTPLIKPLGLVACDIVADIFLDRNNPDSKIEITLPNRTVSLKNNKRYSIHITNDCFSHFTPGQTDFHLHYNAFYGAFKNANDQFHLVPHGSKVISTSSVMNKNIDEPDYHNDKAPCMGIALGRTSTFNK